MRPVYTLDRYRAAAKVLADAALAAQPLDGAKWPATSALLAELGLELAPSSQACLVAAGLTSRPSGRAR